MWAQKGALGDDVLIDIAMVVLAFGLGLLGFFRGLFSQAWGIAALALAFFGAEPLLEWSAAPQLFGAEGEGPFGIFMMRLLAGLVIYISALILGRLVEFVVIERLSLLKAGNRVLGGLLGGLKGALMAIILLFIGLFVLSHSDEVAPVAITQANESVAVREFGGYNPLNLLFLNRLRPYLFKGGEAAKPLPKAVTSPAMLTLMEDPAFVEALAKGDMEGILLNPAYQRAMAEISLTRGLAHLGPGGS